MATSLRNRSRWTLAACAVAGLAGPARAVNCDDVSNTLFITHWSGGTPSSVSVEMRKNGTPAASAKPLAYSATVKESKLERAGTVLVLTSADPLIQRLPAANDYRIVIDGRVEYLLHDIVMTDRAAVGCPTQSAMVNECKLEGSKFISAEASCGRPLQASVLKGN